jgi:hypothetical protein
MPNQVFRQIYFASVILPAGLAALTMGSYYYTMEGLEERTSQQLLALKLEQKLGIKDSKGTESTKSSIMQMLNELPNKTRRQKVEAAVDAAHKSHGIGFRNSSQDPVDVPMPTSFTDFNAMSSSDFTADDEKR